MDGNQLQRKLQGAVDEMMQKVCDTLNCVLIEKCFSSFCADLIHLIHVYSLLFHITIIVVRT